MTHDELLSLLSDRDWEHTSYHKLIPAFRAVIKLHKPYINYRGDECSCNHCGDVGQWPCPTIQEIMEQLK